MSSTTSPSSRPGAGRLPQGKALWIRNRFRRPGETPRHYVDRYAAAGFRWASPVTMWGAGPVRELDELYEALRANEIPSWPLWGLPTPETWRDAIDAFLDYARDVGAAGVIVDPEVEWVGHEDEARAFAAALRAGCDARGLLLAITSYSLPSNHRRFPWAAFAAVADLGIAQTYDRDLAFDRTYFLRALRQWRAKGFREVICAGGLWNHRDSRDKTQTEVRRHLNLLPQAPAVIFWNDGSITPSVWAALRRWRSDAGVPWGALATALGIGLGLAALRQRRG